MISRGLLEWLDERARSGAAVVRLPQLHGGPHAPHPVDVREAADPGRRHPRPGPRHRPVVVRRERVHDRRAHLQPTAELAAIRGVYDAALVDSRRRDRGSVRRAAGSGESSTTPWWCWSRITESTSASTTASNTAGRCTSRCLHVPLVIRYPGGAEAGRVAERVSTGRRVQHHPRRRRHRGARLAPRPAACAGGRRRPPHVFSQLLDPYASQVKHVREVYGDAIDYTPLFRTYCAAFQGPDKLIYASDGQHRLYDLDADPAEANDRAPRRPRSGPGPPGHGPAHLGAGAAGLRSERPRQGRSAPRPPSRTRPSWP